MLFWLARANFFEQDVGIRMDQHQDFQIKLLLYFLESDVKRRTVTDAARALGKTKASVSRALDRLEERGLVRRVEGRKTILTAQGIRLAQEYQRVFRTAEHYMQHQNLSIPQARENAMRVLLAGFTPEYLARLEERGERLRIKEAFSGRRHFSGAEFCRSLKDGSYALPFTLHWEQWGAEQLFPAREYGFDHPCELVVHGGRGMIYLEKGMLHFDLTRANQLVRLQVCALSYRCAAGGMLPAEGEGRYFVFPAEVLTFIGTGSGESRVLQGGVQLGLELSAPPLHVPAEPAEFTLFVP